MMPFRFASILSALLGSAWATVDDASILYQRALTLKQTDDSSSLRDHGESEAVIHDGADGPVSDLPWKELEKHQLTLDTLNNVLKSVSDPLGLFLGNCTHLKNFLRADVVEDGKAAPELARALGTMLSDATSDWAEAASTIMYNVSMLLKSRDELMDTVHKLATEFHKLTKHVNWFAETGARVIPTIASSNAQLVPAELGVLKVAASEFSMQKDASSNAINDIMQEMMAYHSQQVKDPIVEFGSGSCLDANGSLYSTFEKPGCETRIGCMNHCRKFAKNECHGVTFSHLSNGCGRCELRMESGFNGTVDGWRSQWTAASGKGPVASTNNETSHAGGLLTCYRREEPEWESWPSLMRDVLKKDLDQIEAGFYVLARLWRSGLFKMDRAFWQIESGIAESSAKILELLTTDTAKRGHRSAVDFAAADGPGIAETSARILALQEAAAA